MHRKMKISAATVVGFLLFSTTAGAQAPHKQKSPLADAIQAMFGVHEFEQAEISPDGKRVAWVESLVGKDGTPSPNSAIFIADVKSSPAPRRISAGDGSAPHAEHDIAWSPNGKKLAFLSDASRTGQLQLYVADTAGASGPAKKLTGLKGFLENPGWSPDGKTIAVLFTENAPRPAGPLEAETPPQGVIESTVYEQRLTLVDAATGRTRQISPADMYVYEFDWSPDGKRLACTAARGAGDDNWYVAEIYIFDAATGAAKSIGKPEVQIASPRWSPDGETIAFVGGLMSDEPIPAGDIYIIPAAGGRARNITPAMKASASWLEWAPGNSKKILFAGYFDGGSGVATLDTTSSKVEMLWMGAESLTPARFGVFLSLSRDAKTSAVIRQSYADPPEVWAGPIGAWKQITRRNASLQPAWGEAKSLEWTTDIGAVQGWLIYPRDYDSAKHYPMVVDVHGGPAWSTMPHWPSRWDYPEALPAAGYFVLRPNPRGSYGHGEAFTRANVKDFGYGDFRDILGGVDAAVKSAPIDEHRIGITGWSYGGFMTMWAVTQTSRFRAAVAGAGLANWTSYYGENGIDQWMIPYFGASVYDDPAVYAKSQPINFIKNANTPTLVLVGDSDGECPTPQSFEFWHALKTLGVETQFVVYPHEGHEFARPAHSRDVIERALAWFDKHMP